MEQLRFILNAAAKSVLKDGREWLVAPLTTIVPGVLAGSKGPLMYRPSDIRAAVHNWDGIPITVRHPVTSNGEHVSASAAGIWDRQGVGHLRNSRWEGKLKHDGWFDVSRLQQVQDGQAILNALRSGTQMELSTGLFTDNVPEEGTYNGRWHSHVARGHVPDHLAILPDQVGACSVQDGCGLNVNAKCSCNGKCTKCQVDNLLNSLRDGAGRFAGGKQLPTVREQTQGKGQQSSSGERGGEGDDSDPLDKEAERLGISTEELRAKLGDTDGSKRGTRNMRITRQMVTNAVAVLDAFRRGQASRSRGLQPATSNAKRRECPECGGEVDEDGECEECGYVVENAFGTAKLKKTAPVDIDGDDDGSEADEDDHSDAARRQQARDTKGPADFGYRPAMAGNRGSSKMGLFGTRNDSNATSNNPDLGSSGGRADFFGALKGRGEYDEGKGGPSGPNTGGGGGSRASVDAHAASRKANKSGKSSDHAAAASEHREAAEHHRNEGDKEMAKHHADAARSHTQKAKSVANSRPNLAWLRGLIANCTCSETAAQLRQVLNEASGTGDGSFDAAVVAGREGDGDEDDDDQGKAEKAKRAAKAKAAFTGNRLTPAEQEALSEAQQIVGNQKLAIARQLVANIQDDERREARGLELMGKSLGELRGLLELVGNRSETQHHQERYEQAPPLFGPTGLAINEGGHGGGDDDTLDCPTINWGAKQTA